MYGRHVQEYMGKPARPAPLTQAAMVPDGMLTMIQIAFRLAALATFQNAETICACCCADHHVRQPFCPLSADKATAGECEERSPL